jgi:octopine/nopaline transport system permease protein
VDFSLLAWGDAGWGDQMARGAVVTILVAVAAYALGVLIGAGLAAMKLSPLAPLR